jgi:S1-C subfamily serine protease
VSLLLDEATFTEGSPPLEEGCLSAVARDVWKGDSAELFPAAAGLAATAAICGAIALGSRGLLVGRSVRQLSTPFLNNLAKSDLGMKVSHAMEEVGFQTRLSKGRMLDFQIAKKEAEQLASKIDEHAIPVRQWSSLKLPKSDAVEALFRDNKDSIVKVLPFRHIGFSDKVLVRGHGTGFFVDSDGTIATAKHVLSQGEHGAFILTPSGEARIAEHVRPFESEFDVGFLRISPGLESLLYPKMSKMSFSTFRPVRLAADGNLSKREVVASIGFAENKPLSIAPGRFNRSVGMGPIFKPVGQSEEEFRAVIEKFAPRRGSVEIPINRQISDINIGPGGSGGPLFRLGDGKVVGIVTHSTKPNIGPGFAEPKGVSFPVEVLHRWMSQV